MPQTIPELQDREFVFTDKDFQHISELVGQKVGIVLAEHKKNMVYSRLARRLRAQGYKHFSDYLKFLQSDAGQDELVEFVNAITTNLTHFFREGHHFDHLRDVIIPEWLNHPRSRRIRIWSAGCSAGMEPYSIAMVLHQAIPNLKNWDIKILATDIDTNMLDTGVRGEYDMQAAERIPRMYQKYVEPIAGTDKASMAKEIRPLIAFKKLNLLESWPVKGPFDVVFCRNVVIYFSKDTQRVVFDRFASVMPSGSTLFIGHSENLFNITTKFASKGKTIYQRVA
ncbi:MAG: protein-glutamate O-methyltransferase CheR [Hyphomicrobiales bacterium]|nr:protein-glutamate O-methyltransferase CheR [Hyphomicrobiales bacterium]